MSEAAGRLRKTVIERVLEGAGESSAADRKAAFANRDTPEVARALLDKVTNTAWKVTDEDFAAVKQAGMTDDQIFEVVVSAALGKSTRQLDAALAAVDEAIKNKGAA